jgi:hypothetical protein
MYGFMYSGTRVTGTTSGTGPFDLATLSAGAATAVAFVHEVRVGQNTEFGDAAAEMTRIQVAKFTTIGSGGQAGVVNPLLEGGPTAIFATRFGDSTQATTLTILVDETFNIQAGWLYLPIPETRISVSSVVTEGLVVRMPEASDDTVDWNATITWEEIPIT